MLILLVAVVHLLESAACVGGQRWTQSTRSTCILCRGFLYRKDRSRATCGLAIATGNLANPRPRIAGLPAQVSAYGAPILARSHAHVALEQAVELRNRAEARSIDDLADTHQRIPQQRLGLLDADPGNILREG